MVYSVVCCDRLLLRVVLVCCGVSYWPCVNCCLSFIVRCVLFVVCWLLCDVCCVLFISC